MIETDDKTKIKPEVGRNAFCEMMQEDGNFLHTKVYGSKVHEMKPHFRGIR